MEDKIIELADYFISENTTYREAKIACEKLLKQVSHEIELRAMESRTRVRNDSPLYNSLCQQWERLRRSMDSNQYFWNVLLCMEKAYNH